MTLTPSVAISDVELKIAAKTKKMAATTWYYSAVKNEIIRMKMAMISPERIIQNFLFP